MFLLDKTIHQFLFWLIVYGIYTLFNVKGFSFFYFICQPRATFHFPIGQVSVEEKRNEDDKKVLSVYGIGKSDFLDGVLTAQYNENDLNLRYCYKVNYLMLFFVLFFGLPVKYDSVHTFPLAGQGINFSSKCVIAFQCSIHRLQKAFWSF